MKKVITAIKLLLLIGLTTIVLLVHNWEITIVLCLAACSLVFVVQAKHFPNERVLPLFYIAALIILFQLIFDRSESVPVRIILGAIAAAKITSISLLVFLFTATTSVNSIVSLFNFLPRNIRLVLTITFGIIPAVLEEARSIKLIQNARGLHTMSLNLYKSFIPIIIPLLHRSFQRAERIAILLEIRGL